MRFKFGHFYKHKNMVDVCFRVRTAIDQTPEYVELAVNWFLIRNFNILTKVDLIKITNDQICNYYKIKEN